MLKLIAALVFAFSSLQLAHAYDIVDVQSNDNLLQICGQTAVKSGYLLRSKEGDVYHKPGSAWLVSLLAIDSDGYPMAVYCELDTVRPPHLTEVVFTRDDCDCVSMSLSSESLDELNADLGAQK